MRTHLGHLGLALAAAASLACLDPTEPGALVPATVDEDPELPALQLSQTAVHLETFGDPDDPVVIVLHGGPGNDYRYMLRLVETHAGRSLADDHLWVFWDQRGAGLSRRHPLDELSLDAYLRDLEDIVEAFSPDRPVILFGHSWGGQYAAMYMNAHPEAVAGAILAEPGRLRWDIEEHGQDFDFDYFAEHLGDLLWTRQIVSMREHARADYVASLLLLEDTNDRVEEPSPNWRVGAAVLIQLYLDEIEATAFDWTPRLAEVDAPVLFLAGDRDGNLGAAFQREQLGLFRDATLVELPDAGHTDIVYADVEATIPIVRAYLDELEQP